jgi:arabinose-5-phosphate isomerase
MTSKKVMSQVLRLEAQSLYLAADRLDQQSGDLIEDLNLVFRSLRENNGALIFCGVGKSGIIAMKLASTFCSLGLPSFFLHPIEALHGDLGRVGKFDSIVFISKSGTTEEIIKLLPYLAIEKSNMIALVGNVNSSIAKSCSIVLDCSVEKEACINNQAPTTSSTLALAMGDAMAVLYESQIGLSKEGFAFNHPGGILGKSLRMKVRDIMISAQDCAVVSSTQTLQDVILLMTKYPAGGCAVVDNGVFQGILVEGDIRRTFTKANQGLDTKVSAIVNSNPISIGPADLASLALDKMESKNRSISILPVIEESKFVGFIRLHDLLKEGFSLKK